VYHLGISDMFAMLEHVEPLGTSTITVTDSPMTHELVGQLTHTNARNACS
jgi:hypothetical protein